MNKTIKIVILIVCGYILFVGIVLFFYQQIRFAPEDGAATDFLHMNKELQEEIGEVRYVARRIIEKEVQSEGVLQISYSVETYKVDYHIKVHFKRKNEGWIPYDYTIIEVLEEYENLYETCK